MTDQATSKTNGTSAGPLVRLGAAIRANAVDIGIVAVLATVYLVWLVSTATDLGYSRDEGFYFAAADSYRGWFKVLFSDPARAFEQGTVDRYWRANNEHPAFVKSLFALSRDFLFERWRLFSEPGTSYRFVGMVFSAIAVAVTYIWGKQVYSLKFPRGLARLGGCVAALSFAFVPRVFYHAHLDCFDMPVLAMWMVTSYVYWRSFEQRKLTWAVAAGVLYGLLLNTKHNSWLLPFALVAHLLVVSGPEVIASLKTRRPKVPMGLVFMATLGPAIFYLTWPWIWFDTFARLGAYVRFHTQHVYYNIEFLGQTYFRPPFPRGYAWLMTLATVPAVSLCLFGSGLVLFLKDSFRTRWLSFQSRQKVAGFWNALGFDGEPPDLKRPERVWLSAGTLWLLCILCSYAPWFSSQTPIFGGTKHWMTAYPFMMLFGGSAFVSAATALSALMPRSLRRFHITKAALAALTLLGPLLLTRASHPWGLSDYTPIVGGPSGGADLGLNRGFWGYTTGSVQSFINSNAPKGARVFIHDTAIQSWTMMRKDKRVRKDLRAQLGVANSKLAIYHHEQHMARVEHQIWVDYGSVRPSVVASHQGVPVLWVYERRQRKAASE